MRNAHWVNSQNISTALLTKMQGVEIASLEELLSQSRSLTMAQSAGILDSALNALHATLMIGHYAPDEWLGDIGGVTAHSETGKTLAELLVILVGHVIHHVYGYRENA